MFIAALFTIAKTGKQPNCLSVDDWFKKMRCIYKLKYYSAIKNEILSFVATWMDLENIILSEASQRKILVYDITYMWNLKNNTNESVYKTDIDSDIENKLKGKGRREG